jgi:hypothetical protein
VAILIPAASSLWDSLASVPTFYLNDERGLHYALVHAGYTVDFVDDTDLDHPENPGEFASRGYTTLYITGPNVSAAAQTKVSEWVKGGGTLVVTLGAAVADEYNTSTSILDEVLGLKPRSESRERWIDAGGFVTGTLEFVPNPFNNSNDPMNPFGSGRMDLLGTVQALSPLDGGNGATIVANLITPANSGAGITVHQFGAGRAVAYGFFPGVQYGYSPDRTDPERLPLRWSKPLRDVAVAPVWMPTPRHDEAVRLNHEVVEACRLQSKAGIAVVLLNWTDEPIDDLEVTVTDAGDVHVADFPNVSSAQGVPVSTRVVPGKPITVTMPLKDVDVLLFTS